MLGFFPVQNRTALLTTHRLLIGKALVALYYLKNPINQLKQQKINPINQLDKKKITVRKTALDIESWRRILEKKGLSIFTRGGKS